MLRAGAGGSLPETPTIEDDQPPAVPSPRPSVPPELGEYRVEPFLGLAETGPFKRDPATTVARQLQQLINSVVSEGWEFVSMARIDSLTSPSCLGYLFGHRQSVVPFNMVVFRRGRRRAV